MNRRRRFCIPLPLLPVAFLSVASNAIAGMTVYGLNDLQRIRLEELSFFLLLLLVCTVVFRFLWNATAKDLSWLPRLGWRQAICLSLLLGVFMLLILTMISGIREVLTPDAWRKQGSAYRLNSTEQEPVRKQNIEQLRWELFRFADEHNGQFPKHDFTGEIADKVWETTDRGRSRYIYFAGREKAKPRSETKALLALEPIRFGNARFGILTTGEVRKFSAAEIDELIDGSNSNAERRDAE